MRQTGLDPPIEPPKKTKSPEESGLSLVSVGVRGFEPRTSSSRTMRATRLRYTPLSDGRLLYHPALGSHRAAHLGHGAPGTHLSPFPREVPSVHARNRVPDLRLQHRQIGALEV
jgi:hypothetical protein